MPIWDKYIHVHIPRTGGTSLIEMIGYRKRNDLLHSTAKNISHLPAHYTASKLKSLIGEDYDSYYKWTFVRNPYDRLFSCYNYLVKKNWYINNFPNTYIILNKPKNFIEFVNNLYELFKTNKLPWMKQNKKISLNSKLYNLESTSKDFLLHLYPQYIFFSD